VAPEAAPVVRLRMVATEGPEVATVLAEAEAERHLMEVTLVLVVPVRPVSWLLLRSDLAASHSLLTISGS
jgi:hypothetical protein